MLINPYLIGLGPVVYILLRIKARPANSALLENWHSTASAGSPRYSMHVSNNRI